MEYRNVHGQTNGQNAINIARQYADAR